jgi:hypothetical protein
VYVIRDLDNHSLGGDPISIDDIEDWSLGEADEVDARLVNELAQHPAKDEVSAYKDDHGHAAGSQLEFDWAANSSLDRWLGRVSSGKLLQEDLSICSGLRNELTRMGLLSSGSSVGSSRFGEIDPHEWDDPLAYETEPERQARMKRKLEAIKRGENHGKDRFPAGFLVTDDEVLSAAPAGVRPFLRRTLDTTDKLTRNPLSVVDTLADSLVKGVSKLGGQESKFQ